VVRLWVVNLGGYGYDVPRHNPAFALWWARAGQGIMRDSHENQVQYANPSRPRATRRTPSCNYYLNRSWVSVKSSSQILCSLVVWRHLVVNVADERYPHLRGVVAAKDVAGEMRLHLHMYLHRC
jgi:hypothetical protein